MAIKRINAHLTIRATQHILCMVSIIVFAQSLLDAKTIILDPGHGGVFPGQTSVRGKLREKDVVLDLAKKLAQRLRKKGYKVILTREIDKDFDKKDLIKDLEYRARMTKTYNADIFVSIHLNSSKNKGLRGYEVYVPYECKYPAQSYKLACGIHYELSHKVKPRFGGGTLGNLNNIDHGIKASKFNVLKKAQSPAVVVELDYLSNTQSETQLLTTAYRNKLVSALYCGIRRFFES